MDAGARPRRQRVLNCRRRRVALPAGPRQWRIYASAVFHCFSAQISSSAGRKDTHAGLPCRAPSARINQFAGHHCLGSS